MNKMRIYFGLSIVLSTLAISQFEARADFFIEPSLGYELGSVSQDPTTTGSAKGVGLGAKLGIDFAGMFFFGLDTHYALPTWKIDLPVSSNSATHFALGAVAGLKIPALPIRAWIGYNFVNSMSVSDAAGVGVNTTYSGSAFKFGLGYSFIPLMSLNIEYVLNSFGTSETSSVSTALTNSISDNVIAFSVSVPLTLPF